ncbi:hypothetical protein NQ314_007488 [Rhamnusium bicolor]|uniref:Ubinuclein middle domain-containing protein n=1 Tax=Rhamnusium bicolor TaxID=1586634 RepID=A0AAV8YLU1_9CUCU|nr:hypothetical protein NQ314_007488 [Rhamnusium bicolor]
MSITSVTDAIESVLKQIVEVDYDNKNKQHNDVNKKYDLSISKPDAPSSLEGESSQEANKTDKAEVVKLPENLPADILDVINKIKQAALDYKGEGKKKFFTDEVNSMLLNLERKCKILGKSSRVRIYDHLSPFIKCGKQTLIRRAKHLVLEDEEKRLKRLTVRLKDNIDQIMPSLMMNFEQESQRILQKKFSKESIDNEENKALKMPRRRFQWTEEARKLIKDILSIKKRCLLLEGKQKDNLEDQMTQYLRSIILPLWPEGWMYLNALKKVYNNMTENSKVSNNNNSKSSTPKQHSSVTITPVSNSKSTSKTDIIPNDVTFNKISSIEIKSSSKLAETYISSQSSNIKTHSSVIPPISVAQPSISTIMQPNNSSREGDKFKYEKDHDYKKPNIMQSSSNIREGEKLKHEKDHDYKKPNIIQSSNSIRDGEKNKHDQDHDYKKPHIMQSSSNIREGDKVKHLKDYDYKEPHIMQSSSNIREGDKVKHSKDHDYKETHIMQSSNNNNREGDKVKHLKDHDYKEPHIMQSSSNIREGDKVKHSRDHDYKETHIMQSSSNIREGDKVKHSKDHDYKETHIMQSSSNIREGDKVKHSKDHDYKETHIMQPSSNIREGDKVKHSKEYDYKNLNIMQPSGNIREDEKAIHEKDHDYKKPTVMQSSSTIGEVMLEKVKKTKHERDHDYKKPYIIQSGNNIREAEKHKHERDHDYKKSSTTQPSSNFREGEKVRHERDHDHKKTNIMQSSSNVREISMLQTSSHIREGEKTKHEKDRDYKKSSVTQSSSSIREGEKKHEREHDYKKSSTLYSSSRETEKTRHERDHDHKKSSMMQPGSSVREGEKPRHERDHDYKKYTSNIRESERTKYENDHDYKKLMEIDSSVPNRDTEPTTSAMDSSVIVINTQKDELITIPSENKKEINAVIPKAAHCQVIDLTDTLELKRKATSEENRPFKLIKESGSELIKPMTSTDLYSEMKKISSKNPDLSVNPCIVSTSSNPKVTSKSDGDDIQMVMENLKALQKLSSPIKADNSASSPVSVIAYNKSFSPKSNSSQSSTGQRTDFNSKTDFTGSFQDEFQKQFINSLQHLATSSSSTKSNYNRCS